MSTESRDRTWMRVCILTVGVAVVLGLGLLAQCLFAGPPAGAQPFGRSTWVWHFTADGARSGLPVYKQLLDALPAHTTVCIATGSTADAAWCARALGDGVEIVSVRGPLSSWARDRYVCFERDGVPHVLVPSPRLIRPQVRGDLLVPATLLELEPDLVLVETEFLIEGGDVLVLPDHVLLGAATLLHNTGTLGPGAEPFLAEVAAIFGRHVHVVGRRAGRPLTHHLDMVLTALDDTTVALGDPRLGLALFDAQTGAGREQLSLGPLGVFRRGRQLAMMERYASAAAELADAGFQVERLPILHGESSPRIPPGTILSWNNVLLERDPEQGIAFVPRYEVPLLDAAARAAWESWGFAVVDVDLRDILVRGGALRCLTNVMTSHTSSEGGAAGL